MASRTPNPLSWRLLPPDGTSYVYWLRADRKWEIERKPRFRASKYELHRTRNAEVTVDFPDCWPLTFDRLSDAKAASEWPRERLLEVMRSEFASYQWRLASICGGGCSDEDLLAIVHQRAIDEDADRTLLGQRKAA